MNKPYNNIFHIIQGILFIHNMAKIQQKKKYNDVFFEKNG